jgi:predicted Zn-dependent protease
MPIFFGATIALLASLAGPAAPAGYPIQKLQVQILLMQGHTAAAMERANQLNRAMPDDLDTYALLVDVYRATNHRAEAVAAAQWMLNIRENDVRGLLRAAELRQDQGDLDGAIDMLNQCYARTSLAQPAQRADILSRMARLFEKQSKTDDARQLYAEARRLRNTL